MTKGRASQMMSLDELRAVRDEWESDTYDLDEKLASGEIPEHDNMYAKAVIELHRALSSAIERVEQLEEALHQDGHKIFFSETGWSIHHLVECRPDMTNCEIHKRAQIELMGGDTGLRGKYKVSIVDGVLDFEPDV